MITLLEETGRFGRKEMYLSVTRSSLLSGFSKRKRRIDTRKVYKHKARLNIHGGQQTHGVNYWETFSPVVNWFSIRLCMTDRYTRQIDFVLAFPQADVECDLFMELPRGLVFEGVNRSTHCVKLMKNLSGQ
jgi:hypothetical protein